MHRQEIAAETATIQNLLWKPLGSQAKESQSRGPLIVHHQEIAADTPYHLPFFHL
uniref:Uncharacterized protein n=1 Tax=Rhizophora mucronata TaxID=61149 RepID=A0A2P2NYS6_RHIMU